MFGPAWNSDWGQIAACDEKYYQPPSQPVPVLPPAAAREAEAAVQGSSACSRRAGAAPVPGKTLQQL